MTTTPEPRGPDIVALVRRDVARAVRDAANHTSSPYFAHGRLDGNLAPLRQRLALLAQRRPDLHARLADHFDVSAAPDDVAAAVARYAGLLLERRLQRTARTTGPLAVDPDVAGAQRLQAGADAMHRTPPGNARPPPARSR